jgi:hypothetical protein
MENAIAVREAEITCLALGISTAKGSKKMALVSELLAFLGAIRNTLHARRIWENQ